MMHLVKKWYPEDDPILSAQIETLVSLLGGRPTERGLEGFLIVCSRLVDEFGDHRTAELSNVFKTHSLMGRRVLLESLEFMSEWVGGMDNYLRRYPVTIIPPRPAFPQFKVMDIHRISDRIYRVLDSRSRVFPTDEPIQEFIQRTGNLPAVPIQRVPVRRSKPRFHWCSYDTWDDPETTKEALQILPEWSDARLRATISASKVRRSAFVAFNGDRSDPADGRLRFYKYFYEPIAKDHPPLLGGGVQIGLQGAPAVETLEQWSESGREWEIIWERPRQESA
jgi:hypothetical protein